ncbi:TolC family outer membrane protein [Nitratidesulfovibrio vulgaris]|uniref:Type I secretion outer membrane protein, TolC family n=2 Tax=Nitratidesulfovibrio vulgaris TaxID=881 RepID=Q72DB6_NITV2|nr:TolC family outer membrane protein [Nitratidesulfovibrio vulgaris]AAS95493.1 type I secretion outer membrane protein, TolC family [Nitratidesulfovibrio vulgaris str. Hildenborough]ABM28994.1 type I secretion outer membrane protein, TolC family [Nitratidesulfovibrio vulgaris DP4]ADP86100.1 type I secretion outer membrane protein, TolC family [Nitratidesulfovibrio vulgaris RCH1]
MKSSICKKMITGATACALISASGAFLSLPDVSFAETKLKDSVLSTINSNPKLKVFQENREAATHDLRRARAGWLPRVDVRAGYGAEQYSDTTSRQSNKDDEFTERGDASAVLTQTVWDGFATSSRVDVGKAKLDSADNRLMDNAEALGLDAVLAHIEVLRQREIVRLSEINVQQHQTILGSQSERQKMGVASIADVTQTQGRLARAQSTLVESRSALEVAEAAYKRLTGMEVPTELERAGIPDTAPASFETALGASLTANPKIAAYQSDIQAARGQEDLDKSRFHPNVYLEVGPSYKERVESSESYAWGTTAMMRVNWNIYDGGADVAAVRGSAARVRQSRQELQNLLDTLNEETRATWSRYLSAHEQSSFYTTAVTYNTQTRDTYMQQFLVGQRSLLDVLDAENELYSSEVQLVTAKANEAGTAYRLLALGGNLLASLSIDRSELRNVPEEGTIR